MNLNKEICGEDENKKCDKLINRYLLRGKKFVDYACFQYGAYNVAISGKADAHFIDDFQYFVFTKSTKSLEAIRILLKNGKYEDVLIILRSMFEGYLASRFIDEKYDRKLLDDFIFLPQLIAENKTYYDFHNIIELSILIGIIFILKFIFSVKILFWLKNKDMEEIETNAILRSQRNVINPL